MELSKSAQTGQNSAGPGPAPNLPYRPQDPCGKCPPIGLIGCGAITDHHLTAYKNAGYNVVALCDLEKPLAELRREQYFPEAAVYTDYQELLRCNDIEVVDIATHPHQRPPIVEAALLADKHVLSQKPFVLDLDVGLRLVELAAKRNRCLAVNQNGRWAPHFSYARLAVQAGLIGELNAIHFSTHWDHSWVAGTEFEKVKHLILYDFAIHWFDMVCCLAEGKTAKRVYASTARSRQQTIDPALMGQALIEFDSLQASMVFDGDTQYGPDDRTFITGDRGSIVSTGPDFKKQELLLHTDAGAARPELTGSWFSDGFHGTMGELLCSIEDNREPSISAEHNLNSLALCFAAVASAERHEAVVPGSVRTLPN